MRKVRNLDGFELYASGDKLVFTGRGVRTVVFEVNPVGPCVAYLYKKVGKADQRMLIGWTEVPETFEVNVEGDVWVQLEPSAEVWVRHKADKVAGPNPGEDQTFTRMEKMGLYADDLTIALHRQATLNNIIAHRENFARDSYQRRLEARLEEMGETIKKLTPKEEASADDKSAAE